MLYDIFGFPLFVNRNGDVTQGLFLKHEHYKKLMLDRGANAPL